MPKVVFSFDHEDYFVPATVDTAKSLAESLSRYGIRGAFCTVGERARFMRRLGRQDAIEALKQHEINQHSNRHSWQPTIAQDLETRDWEDGVRHFLANEGFAADSLREIFGVDTLPAAVPPGWLDCAPQGFYGYRLLGFNMIAGSFISDKPGRLLWYCNLLHQRYNFKLDQSLLHLPLQGVIERFETLLGEEYIICGVHPTILYNSEFVDEVNRERLGAGPEAWDAPQPRPHADYRQCLEDFDAFARYVAERPDCETVTYADIVDAHPNPCPEFLSRDCVLDIAAICANREQAAGVQCNGHILSAAEVFGVLNWAVANPTGASVPVRRLFGPRERRVRADPPVPVSLSRDQIRLAAERVERDLEDFMPTSLPYEHTVSFGGHIRALAESLSTGPGDLHVLPLPDEPVESEHPALEGIRYENIWIWPRDFTGSRLVELGRLQAWTLKPVAPST